MLEVIEKIDILFIHVSILFYRCGAMRRLIAPYGLVLAPIIEHAPPCPV
jgi:hypothetical protein